MKNMPFFNDFDLQDVTGFLNYEDVRLRYNYCPFLIQCFGHTIAKKLIAMRL